MVRVWRGWSGSRHVHSCIETGWMRLCGGRRYPSAKEDEGKYVIDEVVARWLKERTGRSTGEVLVKEEEVLKLLKWMRDILMRRGLELWEEVNDWIDLLGG